MDWRTTLSDIQLLWAILGGSVAGLTGAFVFGRWFGRQPIDALKLKIDELERDLEASQIQAVQTAPAAESTPFYSSVPESVQVWLKEVPDSYIEPPNSEPKTKVLLVANLKGGVAKTMLAANLAAYFSKRGDYPNTQHLENRRVLLVDLDYQGSLSGLIGAAMGTGRTPARTNVISLFDEAMDDEQALQFRIPPSPNLPRLSFYPAEYGFDDFETRQQFKWLAGQTSHDIRFDLRQRLRSEVFQNEFDLVILDTGPRLTTGSIGALAAATHLIVPTTIDGRSMEAAERFLRRVSVFKRAGLCPNLKVIGSVATLTTAQGGAPAMLTTAIGEFSRKVRGDADLRYLISPEQAFLVSTLKRSQTIVDEAVGSLPYLASTTSRTIFNRIGAEIEQRL